MAKIKLTDYSPTRSSNADIDGINIAENCPAGNMNDAVRELMVQLAETNAGTYPVADTWSFADPADLTKRVRLDAGSVGTGQTRVINMPDGDVTLTTSTGTASFGGLQVNSSDAGASSGPIIDLFRSSASPAASDFLGSVRFYGKDSGANDTLYADITTQISVPTDTSEQGILDLRVAVPAGGLESALSMTSAQTVIAAAGTGVIEIRPNGKGSTTNQSSFSQTQFSTGTDMVVKAAHSVTGANYGISLLGDSGSIRTSSTLTSTDVPMYFYNPNGNVGTITTNGSATSYNTSSDGRKKENKRDFDSGSIIDRIVAWLFDWKTGGTGYGVIAQEAKEVFPDAVTKAPDGFYSVDYSKFVPVLLREVKALRARVATLEANGE